MTIELHLTGRLVKATGVNSKKVKNYINNIFLGTEENENTEVIDSFYDEQDALYALKYITEDMNFEAGLVIDDLIDSKTIETGKITIDPDEPVIKDRKMAITTTLSFRQRNCFNTTTIAYEHIWEVKDEGTS